MSESTVLTNAETREMRMAKTPQGRFELNIEKAIPALRKVAPQFMTPERIVKIVVGASFRNPKLLQCEPTSVLRSVLQAVEMGLEPGSSLGEAYLVPFKNGKTGTLECQLIPGYQGLIALCFRSGFIEGIAAGIVYDYDKFEYEERGNETHFLHIPDLDTVPPRRMWEDERNADEPFRYKHIRAVYAKSNLKGGIHQVKVLPKWKIEELRSRSMASGSGPWVTDWEAMACKTALKQLIKTLPKSVEMSRQLSQAMAVENAVDTEDYSHIEGVFETVEVEGIDGNPPASAESGVQSAKEAIKAADKQKKEGEGEYTGATVSA